MHSGTLNHSKVAEEAFWRPQNTGKFLNSQGSTPDFAGGAYSAPPDSIASGEASCQ